MNKNTKLLKQISLMIATIQVVNDLSGEVPQDSIDDLEYFVTKLKHSNKVD